MLCKKCGAQIPNDSVKCEFCGEVFVEEPKPEETSAEAGVDMGDTQVVNLSSDSDDNKENYSEEMAGRSTHDIKRKKEKESG